MTNALPSWKDTPTKAQILDFVARITTGPDAVPAEERIAVFDNDGTLWTEKPLPIQADFILRRLNEMATLDASLREKQPWKAAYERDYAWIGSVVEEHYRGDDTNVRTLLGGVLAAHGGISVEEFERMADSFLHSAAHPTLGRGYLHCAFAPMVELLRFLQTSGFANYIASGGGRDFMRPISDEMYGIPRDRVIGSSTALEYVADGPAALIRKPEADVLDDGPAKPVRIWSRVGRRPLIAGGNSNGDVPMLSFAGGARPALRLLVLHDDAEREFDYVSGAEMALEAAAAEGWTVVSIKNDWSTVFADGAASA